MASTPTLPPMEEWRTAPWLHDYPCRFCGVLRLDHDDEVMGHEWIFELSVARDERLRMTILKTLDREHRGDYDAPLPAPVERRRIREAAGWTQQQIADELHISRHTVGRFEKKAGLVNGRRMSGREPSRDVRVAYSELLVRLLEGEG